MPRKGSSTRNPSNPREAAVNAGVVCRSATSVTLNAAPQKTIVVNRSTGTGMRAPRPFTPGDTTLSGKGLTYSARGDGDVAERICSFDGLDLTDEQLDILNTVRDFVDREIIPVAHGLEARDEYPQQIVDGLRDLGLFGIASPSSTAAWAST